MFLCGLFLFQTIQAQDYSEKDPSPFDFGRMWTFENPPTEWFKEAYNFNANEAWFEHVRLSSLKFAGWCSASFVSQDGLIMTNHHCSRDVVVALQQDKENFDTEGFYAEKRAEERKAEGLYVDQLKMIADITEEIHNAASSAENDAHRQELINESKVSLKEVYASKAGWEGLNLKIVTYYSGGRYSMYGYKRYEDIRLVFIPETDLGFFGGDPDNFTFPRYNLDCTFWRAYDEDGNPLNTSSFYMPFKAEGAKENELVFVIGNPANTERYRTVAQLEYDRKYRLPQVLSFLTNRHDLMMEEHDANPDQDLMNTILGLSNSMKAYTGILKGLNTPPLFNRKVSMEKKIRSASPGMNYWSELGDIYEEIGPKSSYVNLLGATPLRGKALLLLHAIYTYEQQLTADASEDKLEMSRMKIDELATEINSPEEIKYFEVLINELMEHVPSNDRTMLELVGRQTTSSYASYAISKSKFVHEKKRAKLMKCDGKKLGKQNDPLLIASRTLVAKYMDGAKAFQSNSATMKNLQEKISNQVFNVLGNSLPPDATFTLRISDGLVKSYPYNGTIAPYKTTWFGLYDRHYSNDGEFPWSLPKRWLNPPLEFLRSPANFVSTNDIIGGNSGSAIINKEMEVVGLIFDGNIESLPGNFIYDEEYNRSVSVHAGGIVSALKYIYKADNLVQELVGENK